MVIVVHKVSFLTNQILLLEKKYIILNSIIHIHLTIFVKKNEHYKNENKLSETITMINSLNGYYSGYIGINIMKNLFDKSLKKYYKYAKN